MKNANNIHAANTYFLSSIQRHPFILIYLIIRQFTAIENYLVSQSHTDAVCANPNGCKVHQINFTHFFFLLRIFSSHTVVEWALARVGTYVFVRITLSDTKVRVAWNNVSHNGGSQSNSNRVTELSLIAHNRDSSNKKKKKIVAAFGMVPVTPQKLMLILPGSVMGELHHICFNALYVAEQCKVLRSRYFVSNYPYESENEK